MDVPAQPPEGMKKPVPGKVDPGPAELMDCTMGANKVIILLSFRNCNTAEGRTDRAEGPQSRFHPFVDTFPVEAAGSPQRAQQAGKRGK